MNSDGQISEGTSSRVWYKSVPQADREKRVDSRLEKRKSFRWMSWPWVAGRLPVEMG